jgi:internalin A
MSYKAFVSSTFVDLREHRARVIGALRNAGLQVDPMEDWTADSDEPKHVSVDRMRGCDLCILLVGARRGHRPENETLSITQMEVQEAVKRGIDVLAFLYDGESAWPPAHYELDDDEELKRWRAELMEHRCVGTFTYDAASLDAPVRDAIARWIQKQSWPEVHKTYLETLRDAHASIRFLGVGHYKDIQDRPIEELFVDPRTTSQHISADRPPEDWPETSPLLELVSAEKRLVLLGDPGSGKSTLVSWIVWSLAREGENQWKQALNGRTPIVMVLRELSLDRVRTWDDLLAAYFHHWTARLLGRSQYAAHVSELLENGRAMIMLDGLDEVGNPQVQENLRQAVWEGIRRYEGCAWLLTSRVVGYLGYHEGPDPEAAEGGGDRRITYTRLRYVAPFGDDQIKKFAQNWFTTRDQSAIRATQDASRLTDAIHANPYTLRLARTPNLLTMMALIHRERARLPHGRALLYTDIANAYLQSIDEHRRIERLGYSLRDQKQWLGRIGFEMQLRRHRSVDQRDEVGQSDENEEKEILVEGRDVRQWVVTAMRDAGRTDSSEEAADAFLDEICRRSGLLLPRGEDQFAFTHLSFQEFFAAVFFVPQFMRPPRRARSSGVSGAGPEDLHTYVGNRIWHETLVFLVELMFAEHPDWLEELLFCLFGEAFSEVTPRPNMEAVEGKRKPADDPKLSQAILLARLAIDPHTGLAERSLKPDAIARCCAFEAGEQKRMEGRTKNAMRVGDNAPYQTEVLRVLLGADQDELPQVWMSFADAMRGTDVEALCLTRTPIGTAGPLAGLAGLHALDLTGSDLVDLSPLSALRALELLRLLGTRVSDVGPLAVLTQLQSLSLTGANVSDVGPLAALTGLLTLYLGGTQVSDVGPLAALNSLQTLRLFSTKVSDVGPLAALTGLQTLDLRNTQVSDVGPLAALTGLQTLDLSNTQVSDVGPLAALTGLQTLVLSNTQVSDVGPLAALTGLQTLVLRNTQVSDDGVRDLQEALPKCHISR